MRRPSAVTGTMITAGSAIGAGMFSLPVVSSGMWLGYALVSLVAIWGLNYLAARYLLEANLHFAPGDSFDTMVTATLGKWWNRVVGLSIAFLLYILLYAYYSSFSHPAFGLLLAAVVWWSTRAVGRLSTLLVAAMVVTFVLSMTGYALRIDPVKLLDGDGAGGGYHRYVWAALPYLMTSFGFATVVPSLYKYYGRDPLTIRRGLLYGSLIALGVYGCFIVVTFGNVSRADFVAVNAAGGNISQLVAAFEPGGGRSLTATALAWFANFAIVSSFLGVGLGLFDYLADRFSLPDTPAGRGKTVTLTFLPPALRKVEEAA